MLFAEASNPQVDVRVVNRRGQTVLHVLAGREDHGQGRATKMLKWAMQRGADPMIEDREHRTAVDVAATIKNRGILKLFKPDEI